MRLRMTTRVELTTTYRWKRVVLRRQRWLTTDKCTTYDDNSKKDEKKTKG